MKELSGYLQDALSKQVALSNQTSIGIIDSSAEPDRFER